MEARGEGEWSEISAQGYELDTDGERGWIEGESSLRAHVDRGEEGEGGCRRKRMEWNGCLGLRTKGEREGGRN